MFLPAPTLALLLMAPAPMPKPAPPDPVPTRRDVAGAWHLQWATSGGLAFFAFDGRVEYEWNGDVYAGRWSVAQNGDLCVTDFARDGRELASPYHWRVKWAKGAWLPCARKHEGTAYLGGQGVAFWLRRK